MAHGKSLATEAAGRKLQRPYQPLRSQERAFSMFEVLGRSGSLWSSHFDKQRTSRAGTNMSYTTLSCSSWLEAWEKIIQHTSMMIFSSLEKIMQQTSVINFSTFFCFWWEVNWIGCASVFPANIGRRPPMWALRSMMLCGCKARREQNVPLSPRMADSSSGTCANCTRQKGKCMGLQNHVSRENQVFFQHWNTPNDRHIYYDTILCTRNCAT